MALPSPLQREWLTAALETVIAARGEDHFLSAPLLLPEDRFFPDRFSPDAKGVRTLARRMLDYADLGHFDVSIETFENEQQIHEVGLDGNASKSSHDGAAAWFAGFREPERRAPSLREAGAVQGTTTVLFGVEVSKLTDPLGLVGAMAHEVGHAFRHAHRMERRDRDLEEKLTDVTTIYLGFGVLTTAAAARFTTKSHENLGSSYAHSRQGYLSYDEMAYLLAAQLVARGYDAATIKWFAKQLPANQAAVVQEAASVLVREQVVDALGFDVPPPVQPSPLPPSTSWWKKLFG